MGSSDAHILVVDDEAGVRDLLQEYLTMHGFAVSAAAGAAAARDVLAAAPPVDLVVLDLRMPGEDGLDFARELRGRRGGGVAIVMLTASGETVDKVVGLELGADDYLAKPFDPRELLARVRSVLRRVRPPSAPAGAPEPAPGGGGRVVRFGRHLLDLDAHRLLALDGREVPVTAMEFELLAAFAANPDRVLSRDRLLELAHRRGNDPFDRSVDTRVARLRRKIEPDPDEPRTIRTVRGVGYVFVPAGEAPDAGR